MDRKPRVLFIGNSLTYYSGGIDRYIVRIQEFRAERYTKAGATLEDLWNEGGAAERIAEGGWAVVVLQDDLPEGSSQSFDEYGAKLMGGPVGSRLFAESFVADLADHHATTLEAIRAFGMHHPRQAINMLMFCSIPRMQHAYSMVPWDIASGEFKRAHDLILSTATDENISTRATR